MGYVLALLVDRQVLYDNLLMHLRVELAEVIDGMSPEVFFFADENHVCHCSVRLSSPLIHVRTYAPPLMHIRTCPPIVSSRTWTLG